MKEQEPNGKDELTRQDNQPRLNGEGGSMAEGNKEGDAQADGERSSSRGPRVGGTESSSQKISYSGLTEERKRQVIQEALAITGLTGEEGENTDPETMMLKMSLLVNDELHDLVGEVKGELVEGLIKRYGESAGERAMMGASYLEAVKSSQKATASSERPTVQLARILEKIENSDNFDLLVENYKKEVKLRKEKSSEKEEGESKLRERPRTELGILKEIIDFSLQDYRGEKSAFSEKLKKAQQILDKLSEAEDPSLVIDANKFKEFFKTLINGENNSPGLSDRLRDTETENENMLPHCLEDLVETIMIIEEDEFKKGNKLELLTLNKETGEEEVNVQNFTAWIRSKILYWHGFNSTSEVNLFSEISVYKLYRQINFGEMLYDPRYFMKRHMDENGNVTYRKDEKFEALKDHLLYEVWLFMISHNADVKYRSVIGNDSKVPDILGEIYYNNYFTESKQRLLKILKLPDIGSDNFIDCIKNKDAEQGNVGKAIRRLLLAYYHMGEVGFTPEEGDYNYFELALGKDGVKEFYKQIFKKLFPTEEYPETLDKLKEGVEKGMKKRDPKGKGTKDLNIFNAIEKDKTIIKWVREAMAIAIAKEEGLKDKIEGISYERDLSTNIRYAEEWAYSMTYWTGLAARNDTGAVGYDGWTKLQHYLGYKISQLGAERGGKGNYGDARSFYGINRIGLNAFEGLSARGEDGKEYPLLYFIEGKKENLKEKRKYFNLSSLEDFEFKTNAQRQFAINHIGYGYKFYTQLMTGRGLNLMDIITHDPYGRVIIKEKEANDLIWNGFFKNGRYGYDMQGFKWDGEVRGIVWKLGKNGKPEAHFATTSLEKLCFSEEVLKASEEMMKRYVEKYPELADKRYKMRGVFSYFLAKELRAYRKLFTLDPVRRISIDEVMGILSYISNRPVKIEEWTNLKAIDNEKITDTFYSNKEVKWVTQKSKTELSRMIAGRIGSGGALSSLSGFLEAIKVFFKELVKF